MSGEPDVSMLRTSKTNEREILYPRSTMSGKRPIHKIDDHQQIVLQTS